MTALWKATGDTFRLKDQLKDAGMLWVPEARAWATDVLEIATTVYYLNLPGLVVAEALETDEALSAGYDTAVTMRDRAIADEAANPIGVPVAPAPAVVPAEPPATLAILAKMKHRDLIEMARTLGCGKVGVDAARKDVASMAAFILNRHGEDAVRAYLADLPAKAPVAPKTTATRDVGPVPGGFPAPSAPLADVVKPREATALIDALEGLRASLAGTVPMDEARVRAIVAESLVSALQSLLSHLEKTS